MARKIISKGNVSNFHSSKKNTSGKGEFSLNNVADQNSNSHSGTHCGHKYHRGISENSKRPFKSETSLFSSSVQTCLKPSGERQTNHEGYSHNPIINASNGFIPIAHQHAYDHTLGDKEDRSQTPQADGAGGVTVFRTKVLYHSRSDFRPIGLTEGYEGATDTREKEANV